MKHIAFPILVLLALPAHGADNRQLDSHEHGVGELNIAIEDNIVALDFRAPGADIVGFEYVAKSEMDQAAIASAVTALSRPLDLFVMPPAASCSVVDASAELDRGGSSVDDHDHDHDHDDDHAESHDDDPDDKEGHAEFHAEYILACERIDALSQITFAYFDRFENAVELDVQIVTGSGAIAVEVERDEPTIDLTGLF